MKTFFFKILLFVLVFSHVKTIAQDISDDERALLEAKITAEVLKNTYSGDQSMEKELNDLLYSKISAVNKVFIQFKGIERETALKQAIVHYDSLMSIKTAQALAKNYVLKQISRLDSVKILPAKERTYITSVFMNRYVHSPERGFYDNFLLSMHGILKDTIYYAYIYKEEIHRKANLETYNYYIANKDKYDNRVYNIIKPSVYQEYKELAIIDFAHRIASKLSEDLRSPIIKKYDRKIDSLLIRSGVLLHDSRFATAIKFKKEIGLKDWQIDSLLDKASKMDAMVDDYKLKNPIGNFDTKKYQIDQTIKILDKVQHEIFLNCKNREIALFSAKRDWDRIVKAGIHTTLDSATTIKELYQYQLRRFVSIERYSTSDTIANKRIKEEIDKNKPQILAKLDLAIQGSEESKSLKKALAW